MLDVPPMVASSPVARSQRRGVAMAYSDFVDGVAFISVVLLPATALFTLVLVALTDERS
jgi:hypothetical protein